MVNVTGVVFEDSILSLSMTFVSHCSEMYLSSCATATETAWQLSISHLSVVNPLHILMNNKV